MLRVVVSGAAGRMGRMVVSAVCRAEDLELVGAVDRQQVGVDAGTLAGLDPVGVPLGSDLDGVLEWARPDVMVDFTNPSAVAANLHTAIRHLVCPVVGTTGLSESDMEEIKRRCAENRLGCVVAPNFALGAVLMMRLAAICAPHMPQVEIIELHHDQKVDAPSGTAVKTAEALKDARARAGLGPVDGQEILPGARGAAYDGGIRIHSVRLPGLMAHQEVIFGGLGQTLTIRHDSISRESFIPGILLAVRKVTALTGVIYGLENLLFDTEQNMV
ncbi:MAG TPA: 4-hydroxy-tetrahydrodipicolinate reductase [Spirochaetia bacterium]|nr:4-hydroxy-tetrahydrodipicolinate reductase [Spirochaetia bacterium]